MLDIEKACNHTTITEYCLQCGGILNVHCVRCGKQNVISEFEMHCECLSEDKSEIADGDAVHKAIAAFPEQLPRIYYKDFDTGKQRFTGGRFIQWIQGGPLGAWYAVVRRKCSELYIPEYCLNKESREALLENWPKPQELVECDECGQIDTPEALPFTHAPSCSKCNGNK